MNDEMVIVVGADDHNTLGIVRSLGEAKFTDICIIILNTTKSYVAKSKYIKEVRYCSGKPEEIVEAIQSLAEGKTTVLIPSCDEAALLVDESARRLADSQVIKAPSVENQYGLLQSLLDKENTNVISAQDGESGIKVPKSFKATREQLLTLPVFVGVLRTGRMNFPIIAKPSSSTNGGKDKIRILKDASEAKLFIKDAQNEADGYYLIQEFIEKDCEFGVQGVVLSDGEVYIPGIIKKIRQSVVARGSTTYAELKPSDEYIDLESVRNLIGKTGFRGIFDIELMRKGTDIYLCEINYRNGAYGYAYTVGGSNIPCIFVRDVLHETCKNPGVVKTLTLMSETADFYHVRKHNVGLWEWVKELIRADGKLLWNRKDVKPFFAKLLFKL